MKKFIALLLFTTTVSFSAVKVQFHFSKEIIEKTFTLNQTQIIHEETRVTMNYRLEATLISQNLNEAEFDFTIITTGPRGRRTIHEYPLETIPYNKIMTLKYTNYMYPLIVLAQSN